MKTKKENTGETRILEKTLESLEVGRQTPKSVLILLLLLYFAAAFFGDLIKKTGTGSRSVNLSFHLLFFPASFLIMLMNDHIERRKQQQCQHC